MGPGGSRGLQSRCEARRTSQVCSIRTHLRQIHVHIPRVSLQQGARRTLKQCVFSQMRYHICTHREGEDVHIIVVGCGRVGAELATQLSEAGHSVAIIDRYPEAFGALGRSFAGQTVKGIGFDEDVLQAAGIEDADVLAAVTSNDNANLMVAEVARRIFGVKHVIARLFQPKRARAYTQLGIDYSCGTALVTEEIFTKIQSKHGHHIDSFGDFELIRFALHLDRPVPQGSPKGTRPSILCVEFEQENDMRVVAFEHRNQTHLPGKLSLLYDGDIVVGCVPRANLAAFAHNMKG